MKLNPKQQAYKDAMIKQFAESKRAKADPSLFCDKDHGCGKPGDCRDIRGKFDATIPYADPKEPSRGLKLDDIFIYWLCPDCVTKKKPKGKKGPPSDQAPNKPPRDW